jgi:hypothetical protein
LYWTNYEWFERADNLPQNNTSTFTANNISQQIFREIQILNGQKFTDYNNVFE